MKPTTWTSALAAAAILAAAAAPAAADERKFSYSYEAKTLPRGTFEFEQWVTLRTGRPEGTFRVFAFREELEYGITDLLTTALYLNFAHEKIGDESEFEFESVSSEWKYKLSDPAADPIGLLAYAELGLGPDEQELELKFIANKIVQRWNFAANAIVEFEREEEEEPSGEKEWERESKLALTLGASYQFRPGLAAGLEAVHETPFEGTFKEKEDSAFYVGPVFHYAAPRFWLTLTWLHQVPGPDDGDTGEENQVRLILGIHL